MEKRVLLVCIIVGFLGIIATGLGFAAEAKRVKDSDVQYIAPGKCVYPRSPAFALGLVAFLVLVVAHATINASAGFICCERPTSCWVSFCSVFSWLTFVLASLLLLAGSVLNNRRTTYSMDTIDFCYDVLRPWLFAKGAMLGLVSVTFGIIYYLTISSIKERAQMGFPANTYNGGIAMTQPQVPPHMTEQPVFVPENTYNRRQFG